MYLENLRIFNFRNVTEDSVSFSPNVNFIIGQNGQGKTNLIEAIHFLGYSKSFRTSHIKELVKWSNSSMSVFGGVKHNTWDCDLGVSFDRGSKQTLVNGEKTSLIAGYLGKLVCVTFSPDDLSLVKGGPLNRRSFVDRFMTVLSPSLMRYLLDYQKALRSKNVILKEGYVDSVKISAWNEILAVNAFKIFEARRSFIKILEKTANEIHSSFAQADGELNLKIRSNYSDSDEEVTEQVVLNKFQEAITREVSARASLIGPHRDDVVIKLSRINSRSYASQGQARSIVLSLKLAVIQMIEDSFGESPVVLLDDVESELDRERSESFFSIILNGKRQVFITGTDARIVSEIGGEAACQIMTVSQGKVERQLNKLSA